MGDPDAWKHNSQKVDEFLFFAYQLPGKTQQMVDIFSIMMGGQPPENSGEEGPNECPRGKNPKMAAKPP